MLKSIFGHRWDKVDVLIWLACQDSPVAAPQIAGQVGNGMQADSLLNEGKKPGALSVRLERLKRNAFLEVSYSSTVTGLSISNLMCDTSTRYQATGQAPELGKAADA
jgi:hypothetical protein